ncbi:unnamed protein product [Cylicocyclus nassatus]|uniref:Uncharacterized protein n=1 Tax=Cylicocyclus nassatus TaxID=53992 RepID=A0AA36HHX7_CYLNA|nr:unnamed protein product [Cylicocyclus nassatus]
MTGMRSVNLCTYAQDRDFWKNGRLLCSIQAFCFNEGAADNPKVEIMCYVSDWSNNACWHFMARQDDIEEKDTQTRLYNTTHPQTRFAG